MGFRRSIITACTLGVALLPWFRGSAAIAETGSASPPLETVRQRPANSPEGHGEAAAPVVISAPKPVPADLSAAQLAPVAAIAVGPSAKSGALDTEAGPRVQIETVPAGIPFKVYASAYESPSAEVLRTGETPVTWAEFAPGAYRVVFTPPGRAARAVSLQVPAGEAARIQQDFPYGTLKVRSHPKGAEVLCDGRKVGQTPLDWPVLPGRHKVSARWKGRTARVRTIQVADAAEKTVAFDFRTSSTPAKSASGPSGEAKDESMLTKVKGILKKISSGIKKKGE